MGLFKPDWKNQNPVKRMMAVRKKQHDPKLLADLAQNDPDNRVRQAAVEQLNDQDLLAELFIHSLDKTVKSIALDKVEDPNALMQMALHASMDLYTAQQLMGKLLEYDPDIDRLIRECRCNFIWQFAIANSDNSALILTNVQKWDSAIVRGNIIEAVVMQLERLHATDSLSLLLPLLDRAGEHPTISTPNLMALLHLLEDQAADISENVIDQLFFIARSFSIEDQPYAEKARDYLAGLYVSGVHTEKISQKNIEYAGQYKRPLLEIEINVDPEPSGLDRLNACQLIDFMKEHLDSDQFLDMGNLLNQKLKKNFRNKYNIEKALHTFGNEDMVADFERLKDTMHPSDLDFLIPELIQNYWEDYKKRSHSYDLARSH